MYVQNYELSLSDVTKVCVCDGARHLSNIWQLGINIKNILLSRNSGVVGNSSYYQLTNNLSRVPTSRVEIFECCLCLIFDVVVDSAAADAGVACPWVDIGTWLACAHVSHP